MTLAEYYISLYSPRLISTALNASPAVARAEIISITEKENASSGLKEVHICFEITYHPVGRHRFGVEIRPTIRWVVDDWEVDETGLSALIGEKVKWMELAVVAKIKAELWRIKRIGTRDGRKRRKSSNRVASESRLATAAGKPFEVRTQ